MFKHWSEVHVQSIPHMVLPEQDFLHARKPIPVVLDEICRESENGYWVTSVGIQLLLDQ